MKGCIMLGLAVMLGAGCTTTGTSRANAARLSKQLTAYRAEQEKRITTLNRQYQQTYSRLIDDMLALESQKVSQEFELDAMAISEKLVSDWQTQTQPRQFRDVFQKSVDEHFARRGKAEEAMAAARATYASAYKDALIELKALDEARANLDSLASTPNEQKEISDFLRALYSAYRKAEQAANPPK